MLEMDIIYKFKHADFYLSKLNQTDGLLSKMYQRKMMSPTFLCGGLREEDDVRLGEGGLKLPVLTSFHRTFQRQVHCKLT